MLIMRKDTLLLSDQAHVQRDCSLHQGVQPPSQTTMREVFNPLLRKDTMRPFQSITIAIAILGGLAVPKLHAVDRPADQSADQAVNQAAEVSEPAIAAEQVADQADTGTAEATDEEQVTLAGCMEIINDAYKMVRREARKGTISNFTLEALKNAVVAAEQAGAPELYPVAVTKAPADKKEEMLALYQEQMAALVTTTRALQAAAETNDAEALATAIDVMKELKKAGHNAFYPED